jgi:hypothetical protein
MLYKRVSGVCYYNLIQFMIAILLSAGMLFNNVLFARLGGYPLTIVFVLSIFLYALSIRDWIRNDTCFRTNLLFPAITLLVYEFIVHGVLFYNAIEPEWLKSYALLWMYVGILLVTSRSLIRPENYKAIARCLIALIYFMGGLGIIQFCVSNIMQEQVVLLPDIFLLRVVDQDVDSLRFSGLIRATGVSYEPSFYGIGMTVLAAWCIKFIDMLSTEPRIKRHLYNALFVAIAGVIVSISFTAWGLLGAVLVCKMFSDYSATHKVFDVKMALVSVVIVLLISVIIWPYVVERWNSILFGLDGSANSRLWASLDFIIRPGVDLRSSLLGTGVGLDQTSPQILTIYSRYLSRTWIEYLDYNLLLVNGFSYMAVSMGWLGLSINIWLIFSAFKASNKLFLKDSFLLVLIVGYFFSNARYLWPEWWAILVIVTLIRNAKEVMDVPDRKLDALVTLNGANRTVLFENH